MQIDRCLSHFLSVGSSAAGTVQGWHLRRFGTRTGAWGAVVEGWSNQLRKSVSRQHSITLERSPWKFDWSIYLWSLYSHWWRKKVGLFPALKLWHNLWHSTLSAGLFFAGWSRLWCWHGLPTNKVCVSKFGSNRYGTEFFSDSRGGTALVDGV